MAENKEARIQIRVTEDQHEKMKKAADAIHLPLTTWIRALVIDEAERIAAKGEQGSRADRGEA